jgi:phospholipid/cholesterol/gamma-HCH transport system ATP-binding protein
MKENIPGADESNIVISIRGLVKKFDAAKVLNGLEIDIYKGENLAVLGRSGSGKSVLIKIIAGLLAQDEGTVVVLGKEVSKLTVRELQEYRRKIGFSFQNSALYDSMTVRQNLEFPLVRNKRDLNAKQIKEAVESVLENVGLPKTINQMPSELSGGQRKRIGIARTLILHPEIMLYDEPTAGLDPITSVEINNLINKVQKEYNTTAIIITHDLTCAKETGDKVAVLSEGRFIEKGSFDEVFKTSDKIVRDFYDYNFTSNK